MYGEHQMVRFSYNDFYCDWLNVNRTLYSFVDNAVRDAAGYVFFQSQMFGAASFALLDFMIKYYLMETRTINF